MPYDPNQPRKPAGTEEGGQWTDEQLDTIESAARKAAGLPNILRNIMGAYEPTAEATQDYLFDNRGVLVRSDSYTVSTTAINTEFYKDRKFANERDMLEFAKKQGYEITEEKKGGYNQKIYKFTHTATKKAKEEYESSAKKVFVRYGNLPPGGISKNYLTNTPEIGTSVFNGRLMPDDKLFIDPNVSSDYGFLLFSTRPIFIVDGEVVGLGSDGEPVIKNPKIIRKYR